MPNLFQRVLGLPTAPVPATPTMVRCPMCGLTFEQNHDPFVSDLLYIGDEGTGWHGRCFARRIVELGIEPVVEDTKTAPTMQGG